MHTANRHALKEWAVVCAAIAEGCQSLLLRKGGLRERGGRFRCDHAEFWLFPTRFHQDPGELVDDARPLLSRVQSQIPAEGIVPLNVYIEVEDVAWLDEPAALSALAETHILSQKTVEQRFRYRRAGLALMVIRAYALDKPLEIDDIAEYAGCHSWVELDQALPTSGLRPVLDEAQHSQRLRSIRQILQNHKVRLDGWETVDE